MSTTPSELIELPVVVIGAGPIGLAAAAHLLDRDLTPLVFEAGAQVGAAMRAWGHVRTFTPWQFILDATAVTLLADTGWAPPPAEVLPTGAEIADAYLQPLAGALADWVSTGTKVIAVSRDGMDKTRSLGRDRRPFLVRTQDSTGRISEHLARAVIDASGTWGQRNPLGGSGLPAIGEDAASLFIVDALPDVLGADRARFAGRRTLVVRMGHSAANTLLALGKLATEVPGTDVVWAIRRADGRRLYGGGAADELPARGQLGTDLASMVATGVIELVSSFSITELLTGEQSVDILGQTPTGDRKILGVQTIVAATGFRPDLAMLREVRLDLDPLLEAPRELAPLIDPNVHSCGTVPPHGHRELTHPEAGFYLAGMKSYGRAPTFLITTGNEQVRSIAAAIAGDLAAADHVELVLPETGVCSVTDAENIGGGSCCAAPSPSAVQVETREGIRELPLVQVNENPAGTGCCA